MKIYMHTTHHHHHENVKLSLNDSNKDSFHFLHLIYLHVLNCLQCLEFIFLIQIDFLTLQQKFPALLVLLQFFHTFLPPILPKKCLAILFSLCLNTLITGPNNLVAIRGKKLREKLLLLHCETKLLAHMRLLRTAQLHKSCMHNSTFVLCRMFIFQMVYLGFICFVFLSQ